MNMLKDRVIVITGSTRGIGLSIARACAEAGATVVVSSRQGSAVEQTVRELKEQDFRVSGMAADVSVFSDLEKLMDHALKTWGRIDVWVNNAGISGGYLPLDEMDHREIERVVDVNLTGTLMACNLIIPYFIQKGGGILLNMSGRGGRSEPSPYMTAYAATKAAVTNLTRSLAKENKNYPISIHAVLPGMVKTDLYRDIRTSPRLAEDIENLPIAFKAFGVPIDEVGRFFISIAAQQPGRKTGKLYSVQGGWNRIRGVWLMIFYLIGRKFRKK